MLYAKYARGYKSADFNLTPVTAQVISLGGGQAVKGETVQLWPDNLLNKTYYINTLILTKSTGIVQGYPGNPRSFGVRLRTNW